MKLETLRDLYVEQLRDIYSAETQLVKALPKMAEAANSPDLKAGFEQHLAETERHVKRLEGIFDRLGKKPSGHECKGMKGLITEGEELIKDKPDPDVLDAGLIAAAQRVEHYEIAAYGTVATYANMLGEERDASILHETLEEERSTDRKLTMLAEQHINRDAQQ